MNTRLLYPLVGCALLAGCASGPAYRPAEQAGDYGYRDTLLTSDRYRVSFVGDAGTARENVETFALFRAADVSLAHGYDHFRITARETSPITTTSGTSIRKATKPPVVSSPRSTKTAPATITTTWPGADPTTMEEQVTQEIEDELTPLADVKAINSDARVVELSGGEIAPLPPLGSLSPGPPLWRRQA